MFFPMGFKDGNNIMFAASNIGRDKIAVVEFDPSSKKEVKELYSNADYDIESMGFSKKRKVPTYILYQADRQQYYFLDEETKSMYAKLEKEFSGYDYQAYSNNDAEDKYIIWVGSDRLPAKYYYYDKKADKFELLVEARPWIKESDMARMTPVEYKSRDGLTIRGYLTLPKGVEAKNLPVVVNPHGGPWARDTWGYNPEVQFLANKGYAVLQMNFRGSTGYGRKFWESSFKQWGKAMQDDITDGVKWLIDSGVADPKRVGIYGGSYGGYATLMGITKEPDLYAAAVDYVGVSNLFTFMKTIPPYWKPYMEMWYAMVGDPSKDSLAMVETSPALNADKIKVPLFIAQGANDPRVNKAESDQVVEALKKKGINVEYMVKDDEGHGFLNEENRFDFYGAMEKFLDKNLKNKKVLN
jgi:dipeptidyl aminopeptidase/acylaminoacyl peptidase